MNSNQNLRQQAKASTRKALKKSALKLYCSQGISGVSMNKVAKGAGIAQPSFYNHFSNLDELLSELRSELTQRYMEPLRRAVVEMLSNVDQLSPSQFKQYNRQLLTLIFAAAFENITLFQRLIQDRPRFVDQTGGLAGMLLEIQNEWALVLRQGLKISGRCVPEHDLYLYLDSTSAQVHELILGCHEGRYSQEQAIETLSINISKIFNDLLRSK
jgi:AcrR family transcriptional regulator